jgi:hypothetical protein
MAQRSPTSIGKAPSTNIPFKNPSGVTTESTIGYGGEGIANNWYSVGIPSGTATIIGPTAGTLHQGGDFDGSGTFYAVRSPNTLVTVNVLTGVETVVAVISGVTTGQTITSLGWNPTNLVMYLGSTDITASQLYTINLTTGVATFIGGISNCPGLIAIGINCTGQIFGVDIQGDNLVSINPATGAGTIVGALGFNANYAQDADFDFSSNTLYLSAYNLTTSAGELRTADLTTGATTLVVSWGAVELTSFGIQGSCGAVPVEFNFFEANPNGYTVDLKWSTATETNNKGFEVERKSGNDFETISFVPGSGTSTQTKNYSFSDKNLATGNYTYRLKQIDLDGTVSYSAEVKVETTTPNNFALEQNYPNPFNPSTIIRFSLPTSDFVTLSVYNTLGEKVAQIINKEMEEGYHEVSFNAANLPSGLYFYEIKTGNFSSIKKMLLMK